MWSGLKAIINLLITFISSPRHVLISFGIWSRKSDIWVELSIIISLRILTLVSLNYCLNSIVWLIVFKLNNDRIGR